MGLEGFLYVVYSHLHVLLGRCHHPFKLLLSLLTVLAHQVSRKLATITAGVGLLSTGNMEEKGRLKCMKPEANLCKSMQVGFSSHQRLLEIVVFFRNISQDAVQY